MPDQRFYESLGPATLLDLAEAAGAELIRPEFGVVTVTSVAALDGADDQSISFLVDRKFAPALASSRARACFLPASLTDLLPEDCIGLTTRHPQYAYARAADLLHRPRVHEAGAPAIHPQAQLEDGVVLGPGVVVGPGAAIGRGTVVGANTVIGPGVQIGRNCQIGSNASIGFALIGDRVKIYSGAVIGEPGFGAAAGPLSAPWLFLNVPQAPLYAALAAALAISAYFCLVRR